MSGFLVQNWTVYNVKAHHKLITIDDHPTIIGSFNYTGRTNLTNDENIVILGDLDEIDPVKRDAQAVFGTISAFRN